MAGPTGGTENGWRGSAGLGGFTARLDPPGAFQGNALGTAILKSNVQ